MIYADYEYYSCQYGGKVSAADFRSLSLRASYFIDAATSGKAAAHADDERVKDCCCALVDLLQKNDMRDGIASETNDGVSITYTQGGRYGSSNTTTVEQHMYDTVSLYLGNTGLLYAGVTCI